MKRFSAVICIIVLLTAGLCGCSGQPVSDDGLKIVCTTFPQYDFIKNILGSDDNLSLLISNGSDLHGFEPTAKDIVEIRTASLFVYVGGASDLWVERTIVSTENPNLKSVAIMDYVDTLSLEDIESLEHGGHHTHDHSSHDHSHSPEDADEHIWLSIRNAIKITEGLCEEICSLDPDNASLYRSNTAAYIEKLTALDKEYESVFANGSRDILLFADRFPFGYLTHDYGISHIAAFTGCSSESEVTAETFAHLIEHTNEHKLPYVLILEGSDGKTARTVCEATGADVLTVDSCQTVSSDDIKNGTDYLGIMTNNLEIFKEALG
ncbi:MAG: zinc ABC transporter substrate-binding protein [Clostridia bacterium]|nr:zinc ABC transporter substrate-binding protein [Clostridia bacterium]